MSFSIIIPLYNEASRLPRNIDTIFHFFASRPTATEIIFVNDGSQDDTEKLLQDYQGRYDFKIVSYSTNHGKGYAVRQGIKQATGDWSVFFDIDLATPLAEFDNLLNFVKPTDQVIIGSRRLKGSDIKVGESKLRTFLGHGFTKLSNTLIPGVTDFTCGFKCFARSAADKIFPVARIDRWGFDTELLYIAKLKKLSIREMPVAWSHDSDSRVRVVQAIFTSLADLFRIKFNQLRGFYK